jgi:ribonuclease P/MRP protein subunit RPP1
LRKFIDFQVKYPSSTLEAESLALNLRKLGFKLVALTLTNPEKLKDLKEIFSRFRVETVNRLNLKPENPRELLNQLTSYRRKFEVISVICENRQVARQAAKDHRVDTLIFPAGKIKLFDRAEVELASITGVALEFTLSQILSLKNKVFTRFLAEARVSAKLAVKKGIPIVFSSGAEDVYGLRAPRDLAALTQVLLGISQEKAMAAVSIIPEKIVEKNREKLSSSFIEAGVKLIGEERDG